MQVFLLISHISSLCCVFSAEISSRLLVCELGKWIKGAYASQIMAATGRLGTLLQQLELIVSQIREGRGEHIWLTSAGVVVVSLVDEMRAACAGK